MALACPFFQVQQEAVASRPDQAVVVAFPVPWAEEASYWAQVEVAYYMPLEVVALLEPA